MPAAIRVLLLHNIVAPYRLPLFRALSVQPGLELTVWFMAVSARNRRWNSPLGDLGFEYSVLPNFEISYTSRDLFTYIVNYTFPQRFARQRVDVLISAGWLDFASQAGFFLSKVLRRRFVLWSESTEYERSWRRTLARPLVETIVKASDAHVAFGARSRRYLVSLGAAERSVFTALNTVDVEHFAEVSELARVERDSLRRRLGISCRHVVLYAGQLIERKGVRDLLEAFGKVQARHTDLALVILGHGPLRKQLELLARDLALRHVHFVGDVDQPDMPAMYALADLLVLPSWEETWGLVVNEAMACGLPVIVSDRVGAGPDLVRDGVNGFVVQAGDVTTLADRIGQLVSDETLLRAFAAQARARIITVTPNAAALQLADAVRYAYRVGGSGDSRAELGIFP